MASSLITRITPLSLLATASGTSATSIHHAQALLTTARRTLHAMMPSSTSHSTRPILTANTSRRSFSHLSSLHNTASSSSSSAPPPPPPPPSPSSSTHLTRTPSAPEEPAVLSGGEPSITLLERGAVRLNSIAQKEGLQGVALRVEVMPGGCHGYQYAMSVEESFEGEQDDFRFTSKTYPRAHVLIDSVSLRLLKGATIDYATELIGSQFVIKENPQSKGAGCGCGVSWEPVEGAL